MAADSPMDAQPPIDAVRPPPLGDDRVAALETLVQQQSAQIAQLLEAASATVMTSGEPAPMTNPLTAIPAEHTGTVSSEARKAAEKLGVRYIRIILEENQDIPPTGLFLSHNGRSYVIKPGEPVDVPDFLLGILNDAVASSPVVDNKSQKILGYRNRMRYPYRRVD